MKWKLACIAVVALSLGAGGTADDEKKELAKFAGAWSLASCYYDGTDHNKLKFKIVFKGDEGKVEGNDAVTNEYGTSWPPLVSVFAR